MYPLNVPGFLLLYNVVTLFALFFIRRQLQMTFGTTLIALVTLVSLGFLMPVSLEMLGLGWTISMMTVFLIVFLSMLIFSRIREDRELERQVERVLKPHTPIFTLGTDNGPDVDKAEEQVHLSLKEAAVAIECEPEIEAEIETEIEAEVETEIEAEVETEIEAEIETEIEAEVESEIEAEVESEIEAEIETEIEAEIEPEIETEVESEIEAEIETEIEAEIVSTNTITKEAEAAFKLEQIQKHYQAAVEALERKEYSQAYTDIDEALQLDPPWAARKMLTYQSVTILNEMGMYEHSIKQLKKLMDHLPIGKYESNYDGINQQITYLKVLMHLLETEQKQHLSYSLIPEIIRRQAKDDSLSMAVAESK
ncbi:hypothetical protein [Brevibacillus sp. SYSU BS000544]|uniref:hypothetical protein n=1 Tax=Brevibacillus sp. SYSU BS000544 TaxID=3416443 RepID=UPI003CE53334